MNNPARPTFVATGWDAPRADLPFVERNAIAAMLRDPKTGNCLCLRWKKTPWETFVTGGIEEGQTDEEAARAEIYQETGYKNIRLMCRLPFFDAKFYHAPKMENRWAHVSPFVFELVDEERDPISEEEQANHECVWLTVGELIEFRLPEGHRYMTNCFFEAS